LKTLLATTVIALALTEPFAAPADARSFVALEDCRNLAGYIAVQNWALDHPDSIWIGKSARSLIAIVDFH
jgi:hypothetical protein